MTITLGVQSTPYRSLTGIFFKNIVVEAEWAAMLNDFFLVPDHSFLDFCVKYNNVSDEAPRLTLFTFSVY